MPNNLSKALVFKKAGQIKLEKYKADGTFDAAQVYISNNGVVTTVKRDTKVTTKDLPDGNSSYAAKTYAETEETTITVGFSTYDPDLEAFIKGASVSENATAETEFSVTHEFTIPSTAPYTVVLPKNVKDETFARVLKDKFGNKFTSGEAAAAGTFSVAVATNVATLTFSAADAGKEVFMSYDAYLGGVTTMEYSEVASLPSFRVTLMGETMSYDETQNVLTNVIIDKATSDGSISPPEQGNDKTKGYSLNFKTGKPRAGKKPVVVKFLPLAQ
jgi:hypothetical protein